MMRAIIVFILATFASGLSFGQIIQRHDNETATTFANSIKPDSTELAYTVIETDALDAANKVIIAFYRKTIHEYRQMKTYVDRSRYDILVGYLFVPAGAGAYERRLIDTLWPNGGDPEIQEIFFANADKDKNHELVVLCKLEQRHYDYNGHFYETFIYDYANGETQSLRTLSEKFFGCDCGWRNGKTKKAKYKTAKDIRAGLTRMGYTQ
jgi:hypothetical protein